KSWRVETRGAASSERRLVSPSQRMSCTRTLDVDLTCGRDPIAFHRDVCVASRTTSRRTSTVPCRSSRSPKSPACPFSTSRTFSRKQQDLRLIGTSCKDGSSVELRCCESSTYRSPTSRSAADLRTRAILPVPSDVRWACLRTSIGVLASACDRGPQGPEIRSRSRSALLLFRKNLFLSSKPLVSDAAALRARSRLSTGRKPMLRFKQTILCAVASSKSWMLAANILLAICVTTAGEARVTKFVVEDPTE